MNIMADLESKTLKSKDQITDKNMIDVQLGEEGKMNVGGSACDYFEMPKKFSRTDVIREDVNPMLDKWDMAAWREELERVNRGNKAWNKENKADIKKKIIDKRVSIPAREQMLVMSDSSGDPYDTRLWSSFHIRYIAALVHHIYPKDRKFHARQMHYHMLQKPFCFPSRVKSGSSRWELRPYDGSKEMSVLLESYLKIGRYAGLIPMWKQVDMRTTSVVQPVGFEVKRDIPKDESQIIDLSFNLSTGDSLHVDLETPVIVIFSEKSELAHILEELAKKYYIAYFIGQGQVSVPTARDIYEFIKKHGSSGIVLTMTDYDRAGMEIAHGLARKIQYFVQAEDDVKDAPNIVVYPFKINEDDAEMFGKLGLAKQTKTYKKQEILFYELIALEMLAVLHNKSLEDYVEDELKRVFFYSSNPTESWLVQRDSYRKYFTKQKKRMYAQLTTKLRIEAEKSKKELKAEKLPMTPSTTYLQFEKAVKQRMMDLEGYKVLKSTLSSFMFTPEHLTIEKKHPLGKATVLTHVAGKTEPKRVKVDNEWGFHEKKYKPSKDGKPKDNTGYEIAGIPFPPILADKVLGDSILRFGESKQDVRGPTKHMQTWIEKNERLNVDFGSTDETYSERMERHIADLEVVRKTYKAQQKKYKTAPMYKPLPKDPKEQKRLAEAKEEQTDSGETGIRGVVLGENRDTWEWGNSIKASEKNRQFASWDKWADKSKKLKLERQGAKKGTKEDMKTYKEFMKALKKKMKAFGGEIPIEFKNGKYANFDVGRILKIIDSEGVTEITKQQYEALLETYFDWTVPFYEKIKEALFETRDLQKKADEILAKSLVLDKEIQKKLEKKIDIFNDPKAYLAQRDKRSSDTAKRKAKKKAKGK